MNIMTKIAFGGYLLIAFITLGIGIYYLSKFSATQFPNLKSPFSSSV